MPPGRRRLGGARRHRRLRIELAGGRQSGVGRSRENRAGLVDVDGDQQAAPRGRLVVVQQPLGPVPRRRRRSEHRLDYRADRHARERHSGAVLHLSLDGESARQRPATQRVARVGGVCDRRAQHEARVSGRVSGAETVHHRQPEHDQLHLPGRRTHVADAVHPESVQQPHALRRHLRPGSVDDQPADAPGRVALRARLELAPRG